MSRQRRGEGAIRMSKGLAAGESKAIMRFMPAMRATFSSASMLREKRTVAGNSVLAALVITSLKIVVGIATGSLGILSEAAHSGLDLIAAVVTFFSVRVSDKPADADHQYGHGKFENFSAFIETGLLLMTCVWIVYESIRRLFFYSVEIEPSVAAFLVMLLSMAVDSWRSRALGRIAIKYDSQALEADALHFSTDVWSSSVVIAGLVAVSLGQWLHDHSHLQAEAAAQQHAGGRDGPGNEPDDEAGVPDLDAEHREADADRQRVDAGGQ